MISFTITLLACMFCGCLCFLLGSYLGYQRGSADGFDEGYSFATSDMEIQWRHTAKGSTAPDAARVPVELTIHSSHLQLPLS